MANIDRMVISCMDRRLSDYLDSKYNNGSTIFLRNAGANVHTLSNSVRQILSDNKITKIIIAPHTDCGAMGLVHKALNGEVNPSGQISQDLVQQFKMAASSTRDEIERKVNPEIQKASIEKIAKLSNPKISVELIDLSKLNIPKHEGEHILTITPPSSVSYSQLIKKYKDGKVGMFDSYFIQASETKDVYPDVEIAITALHIMDVRFMASAPDQAEKLKKQLEQLKSQDYASSTSISLIS